MKETNRFKLEDPYKEAREKAKEEKEMIKTKKRYRELKKKLDERGIRTGEAYTIVRGEKVIISE